MLVRFSKSIVLVLASMAAFMAPDGLSVQNLADTLAVSPAHAQKRAKAPKPACKLKAFPFVQGTELVYEARDFPGRVKPKQPPPKPIQPDKLTIKVLSVTTEKKVTTIELEESIEYLTIKTTLTCERDKINIPPESFFFTGEPGGGLNVTLSDLVRDGNTYLFQGGKVVIPEWTEDIKGNFKRMASEGSEVEMLDGSLDLQRVVIIGMPEDIATDLGALKATPVQVDLRGTITLNATPDPYVFNVPANTISKLWFTENLGIVQVFNPNGHIYMLTAINTTDPAAAGEHD